MSRVFIPISIRNARMTEETARKIANVVLGAAAVGAACVVVTKPALRRLAWRLAVTALTGTAPAWLLHEVREAWAESGRSRERPAAEQALSPVARLGDGPLI